MLVFGVTHLHIWKFINLSFLINYQILVLGLILSPKLNMQFKDVQGTGLTFEEPLPFSFAFPECEFHFCKSVYNLKHDILLPHHPTKGLYDSSIVSL